MSKSLVIVESPAKCKKINQILGNNYKVIASYGHFVSLNDLKQINFETYNIKYKVDKGKVLKTIKDEIKKSKEVIIATDDDREGEAIGWCICIFCGLDIRNTKKITFQEITKTAITRSLQNIQHINMNRVKSQQTRQILDIYIGYKVSPLLWKFIANKLSAGRCQTPALKIIHENQVDIDNCSLDTHYTITGCFTSKNITFNMNSHITHENIQSFLEICKDKDNWILQKEKEYDTTHNPPKILTTSTLQQKASNVLKLSPKMTMKYAQELYENGLITYMRTDSACYSTEFIDTLKEHIQSGYGNKYVFKNIDNLNKSSNKNKTQDAHEGIRVTNLQTTESGLENSKVNQLYKLIYKNTVQSGMDSAIYHEVSYIVDLNNDYQFKYIDKTLVFDGWKVLEQLPNTPSYVSFLESQIGNSLSFKYIQATETIQKQIHHYTEASLINKLEKMDIGRPSTYASIVQNIMDKGYVEKKNIVGTKMNTTNFILNSSKQIETKEKEITSQNEKGKLNITDLGKNVCNFCFEHFNDIFNYDFTNQMETLLDNIEQGDSNYKSVLDNYVLSVNTLITNTQDKYKENPEMKIKKPDKSIHVGNINNQVCNIKHGKFGYYLKMDKTNMSLKDFNGFNIDDKYNSGEDITEDEMRLLQTYIEKSKEKTNTNIVLELTKDCSIRKSQYGIYIYFKSSKMKQPKFYKFNNEKDELTEERQEWVNNKDINSIKEYIFKKYKINI